VEQIGLLIKALKDENYLVSDECITNFDSYRDRILRWNNRIHLISKADENRIISRHFLQSIGLLKAVHFPMGIRLLDLGSGPGFPGIPLKIMRPDIELVLAESTKKKARFLEETVRFLGLNRTYIIDERIDGKKNLPDPVDAVVARAVAQLQDLVRWTFSSLKENGKIIAIKGPEAEKEAAQMYCTAGRWGFSRITVVPYNPFPGSFELTRSALVIIEK